MNRKRIQGVKLPPDEEIFSDAGFTSVIYGDGSSRLHVYTVERIKLDWWLNLGIIDRYEVRGYYHASGYNKDEFFSAHDLPLFYCNAPLLKRSYHDVFPILETVRLKAHPDYMIWWDRLLHCRRQAAKKPARWILEQEVDLGFIRPDFTIKDFVLIDNKITCIDPFHDIRLAEQIGLKQKGTMK